MRIPGPDHPITITANPKRVTVTFAGRKIADTQRALSLQEARYPAVQYIPREDVDMTALERSTHGTHCPYKGDAAYYSLKHGERRSENAIWTYEDPFPAVAQIKAYLAFYPDRVDSIEER